MKRSYKHPGAIVLFLMAVVSMQAGCRSAQSIPGQWLSVPVPAEGGLDDFSKKITSHLFENGMMVGIGNDERSIYVFFSPDIQHQRRPHGRVTLTLWLDEEGGKARNLGMELVSGQSPAGRPEGEERPEMEAEERPEPAGPQGPPPARDGQVLLKVVDRRSGRETFIASDGSQGPAVRLATDWGDFSYQLRVPLQAASGGDWPGLRVKPGKPIGIGILWKIEPPPGFRNKGAPGRFRGVPGPGNGGEEMGPPAGMEGGGPGRGSGLPGQNGSRKRTIWLKTFLVNR